MLAINPLAYDICSAVLEINPSAQVSVHSEGTEDEEIVWHDGTTPISKSDIQAKQAEIKADYDSKQYQRKRRDEYPSIDDVTVALAEKEEGDSTMWDEITAKRQAIKVKYPKG